MLLLHPEFEDSERRLHLRLAHDQGQAHLVARQCRPWDDRQERPGPRDRQAWHASVSLLLLPPGRAWLAWMVSHRVARVPGVEVEKQRCPPLEVLTFATGPIFSKTVSVLTTNLTRPTRPARARPRAPARPARPTDPTDPTNPTNQPDQPSRRPRPRTYVHGWAKKV